MKNIFVSSLKLRSYVSGEELKIICDPNCREDRAYLVDKDGHVHTFENLGRLIRDEALETK
jgi:hypothetical protein